MALTAYTLCTIYARQVTTLSFSTPVDVINVGNKQSYTSGTGAYQVSLVFSHQGTLGGTASVTFNLKSGVLSDNLNNALTFSKWKLVKFMNLSTTHTNACCLGSTGANNILMAVKIDKVYCYGRGEFFHSVPINGVTCASILQIKNNSANAITYTLLILGV